MTDQYKPGANWSSKDGKRNVVIQSEAAYFMERRFIIRNLLTDRWSNITISGLTRKFRFAGYDPAYSEL